MVSIANRAWVYDRRSGPTPTARLALPTITGLATVAQTTGAPHALLAAAGFDKVRGRGLMLAVEVADPLHAMAALLRRGVIALPCGEG